jgi:hypothetical protein
LRFRTLFPTLLACALPLGFCVGSARAQVVFTLGNNPLPNSANILFQNSQTGSTVTGLTNDNLIPVSFSSASDTLTVNSAGQASIQSTDGALNLLRVFVPNGTYENLIANVQGGSGLTTITVNATTGTQTFLLDAGNGSNFITLTTTNGARINDVTLTSAGGFGAFVQPRIGGAAATAAPEPSALALLASVTLPLVGMVIQRKRRSQKV